MTAFTLLATLLVFQQSAEQPPLNFTAKLYAANAAVAPGGSTDIAVAITVSSPWHIYHPIILDTGVPTHIEFEPVPGVTLSEAAFPTPELDRVKGLSGVDRIEFLELDGTVVALLRLTVDESLQPGSTIELKARVTGLACIELCQMVETTAELSLPVAAQPGEAANAEIFNGARADLPKPLDKAPYIEGSTIAAPKESIAIDEPAEIVATIRVKPGHHIQDRNPGNDMLIASRLFIEKRDGIDLAKADEQIWSKPNVHVVEGVGTVREQSGEFKIRVPLKITDREFPAGPVALRVLFHYQCCTDAGQCYAPEWAEGWVRFNADSQNKPEGDAITVPPNVTPPTAIDEPSSDVAPKASDASAAAAADEFEVPQLTAADWEDHIPWQHWRPGIAEALARRGALVYVDYTASWCLTCQANKKLVLGTKAVRDKMRDMGVIPIEADFTNSDPKMQAEIKKHGRTTVPLNIVISPKDPKVVGVLPPVLTQDLVFRCLENPAEFAGEPEQQNLVFVLLAGFLGGLILNVMPCVLPVVSIKVLSFIQQAGEDRGRILRLGLSFCFGIMVWFWAFGLLTSQGSIPWQYPWVVVLLGAIIFLFSLNLFGVFEVMLPGRTVGQLDAVTHREGYTGAFLKGLLATLLGTACTAPFLAGATFYAASQPALTVFAVFTAAGLGMASPYLLLSAQPAWLKFVPKPGAWMVTFKQATGFVLLGTAVWLLLVLSNQIEGEGVVWTVAFWGFLALAAWMVGRIKSTWSPGKRATMWSASAAVAAFGVYFCFFWMYQLPVIG